MLFGVLEGYPTSVLNANRQTTSITHVSMPTNPINVEHFYEHVMTQGYLITVYISGKHDMCDHPELLHVNVTDKRNPRSQESNFIANQVPQPSSVELTRVGAVGAMCRLDVVMPPGDPDVDGRVVQVRDMPLSVNIHFENAYASFINYTISTYNTAEKWQILKARGDHDLQVDNVNDHFDGRQVGNNNVSGYFLSQEEHTISYATTRSRFLPRVVQFCES